MAELKRYLGMIIDYGTGADGAMIISSNTSTTKREYDLTRLVINANRTWTVRQADTPLIVRATESITINGTLDGDEAGYGGAQGPGRGRVAITADSANLGAPGFFNNHVLDASNNILAHGIPLPLSEILANELTDLPKGGAGGSRRVGHEDEKYGGAIIVLVAPTIIVGAAGVLSLNAELGAYNNSNSSAPAGGLGVCIGNVVTYTSGAMLRTNGGTGRPVAERNGKNGGWVTLYTRSYTKTGATLPDDVYEARIRPNIPFGTPQIT